MNFNSDYRSGLNIEGTVEIPRSNVICHFSRTRAAIVVDIAAHHHNVPYLVVRDHVLNVWITNCHMLSGVPDSPFNSSHKSIVDKVWPSTSFGSFLRVRQQIDDLIS